MSFNNYRNYNDFKNFQNLIKDVYLCKSGDKMTGDLNMTCNNINSINSLRFCEGTYIGPGNSFDILTNKDLKLKTNKNIVLSTTNKVIIQNDISINGTIFHSGIFEPPINNNGNIGTLSQVLNNGNTASTNINMNSNSFKDVSNIIFSDSTDYISTISNIDNSINILKNNFDVTINNLGEIINNFDISINNLGEIINNFDISINNLKNDVNNLKSLDLDKRIKKIEEFLFIFTNTYEIIDLNGEKINFII